MVSHPMGARFLALVLASSVIPAVAIAEDVVPGEARFSLAAETRLRYTLGDVEGPLGDIDALGLSVPVADISFGAEAASGIGIRVGARLVSEYRYASALNLAVGQAGNPVPVENNMMSEGVLYAPFFGGVVSAGRQKVSFGPSRLSGLMIDASIPFLDSVYFSLPIGKLVISQAVATLENNQAHDGDLSNFLQESTDPVDPDFSYNFDITDIIVSTRRFAWVDERYEIGFGAQALFSRAYNAFHLGEVLPIFSVHNGDVGQNNMSFLVDFESRFIPGHRQYLTLGLDDVNANLFGVGDSGTPTIWAVQAGVSGDVETRVGAWSYDAEVVATHYLWGSFEDELALSRSIYRLKADGDDLVLPLSSPYGPARLSFRIESTLAVGASLDLGLSTLALFGDPDIDLISTTYAIHDVSYEFLLLRAELRATRRFGGLSLGLGFGGDVEPSGLSPRLSVAGAWTVGR